MKRINYLLFIGALLLCNLITGCKTTRTEWINHGEWVYHNQSAHEVEITGVETVLYAGNDAFTVLPGETYVVEVRSEGPYDLPAESMPFPLENATIDRCTIIIDGAVTIKLEPDKGICDRNQYKVEKLERAHYRFTYIITDELIENLLAI